MKNLPTDLLRTFITVKELGGFTQAGDVLGRSQPAISLQIRRLEQGLNVSLFQRGGKLELSEEGMILYESAKKILDINDTIITRLTRPEVSGSVRLGTPNDFEVSFLPILLSRFSKAYPDITLDIVSDISVNLRHDFKKGAFDLVMSMDQDPSSCFLNEDFIQENLTWISSPDFTLKSGEKVPLIVYPQGCIYRKSITEALDKANIPWRVLYCSSSLLGIHSAISAGLGISAMATNTVPKEFLASNIGDHLPKLGSVTIGFNYEESSLSPAASLLLEWLRLGLSNTNKFI